MSRFFFDLVDRGHRIDDHYGEELDNLNEASEHAQAIVAQVVRELLPNGTPLVCICEVRNECGEIVYRASLTLHGEQLTA